jgi:PAS domain S-box-containing protein
MISAWSGQVRDSLRSFFSRPVFRYLGGALAVVVAFFIREALTKFTGPDFPEYVVFYPTVMIVALLAGIWPALLSVLTATAILLFQRYLPLDGFLEPGRGFSVVGLILFGIVCAFLSTVAELYRRSRAKAAAYDKEQALRESQESLRHQAELLRLSFDAIIVWSIGGGIESWNRGAEELYGFTEAQALGRDVHELLHTVPPVPWADFESYLRSRGQWDGEISHQTRDGREVIVSSRQHIGGSIDGDMRVLEIDRDITEQKRVQAELQRAHGELEEKVLRRTSDLKKANRTLLLVSQCDQALVQISDEHELMAVICQIIQDEADYPLIWAGLVDGSLRCVASAAAGGGMLEIMRTEWGEAAITEGPAAEAVRLARPVIVGDLDPEPPARWRDAAVAQGFTGVAALPLLNARGAAFGAFVIYSESTPAFEEAQVVLLKELVDDLAFGIMSQRARTERDQAQKALELKAGQLRILAGELVRTEHRERQRIAQLLHDQFQQLLVAALYSCASLEKEEGPGRRQESIAGITQMLRECIAMSRSLTSELGHPALSEPDLCAGLEWLASWMKDKHGVLVDLSIPPTMVVSQEELRTMLLQATRELLFNVVKHSGKKEAGVLLERSADGSIRITVRDNGVGFDAATIGRAVKASSGIGLFSLRERLALTGGGLEIASAPGHGSSVTVWVPVADPHADAREAM